MKALIRAASVRGMSTSAQSNEAECGPGRDDDFDSIEKKKIECLDANPEIAVIFSAMVDSLGPS